MKKLLSMVLAAGLAVAALSSTSARADETKAPAHSVDVSKGRPDPDKAVRDKWEEGKKAEAAADEELKKTDPEEYKRRKRSGRR